MCYNISSCYLSSFYISKKKQNLPVREKRKEIFSSLSLSICTSVRNEYSQSAVNEKSNPYFLYNVLIFFCLCDPHFVYVFFSIFVMHKMKQIILLKPFKKWTGNSVRPNSWILRKMLYVFSSIGQTKGARQVKFGNSHIKFI